MSRHEVRDIVKVNDNHVLEISLYCHPDGEHHLHLEIKTRIPGTSELETTLKVELTPDTALILGSKLQFLSQLPQFLGTLESSKHARTIQESDGAPPSKRDLQEKIVFTKVPKEKKVNSVVKTLLKRFKGKTVSIMDLQHFLKHELSSRGYREEEFEDALGFLVLMNIIQPEPKESQADFKYWVFTFPKDDQTISRWEDFKEALLLFLNYLKHSIKSNQVQGAKELLDLLGKTIQPDFLQPSTSLHQELLGKDFRVEVVPHPRISIKLVTWASDPLTWQVAHLMAWHFSGRQIIFSKLRESMEEWYELPLVVIENALETLIDNKIVTVEERQAKAGHRYKVYHFPDELVMLFDDAIDLTQQITLLEETIKKISTQNS